jgi:hypothetical protein
LAGVGLLGEERVAVLIDGYFLVVLRAQSVRYITTFKY